MALFAALASSFWRLFGISENHQAFPLKTLQSNGDLTQSFQQSVVSTAASAEPLVGIHGGDADLAVCKEKQP